MTDMPKTCLHCSEVLGCRYLGDSGGIFIPERVITEDNFRNCPDWLPIGARQKWVRDVLYGLQGDGGVRVLYHLPRPLMEGLVKQEQEDKDMPLDDDPDFTSMLQPGMTAAEREEQLRYETDAQGNVLLDEHGEKRARAQYIINKFACSPEHHIQLDHSAGMFYKTEEVIKFILDREIELGLISKNKKPKKSIDQPRAQPSNPQETTVPISGRKIIRPTKGAGKGPVNTESEAADESAPPGPPKGGPVALPRAPGKIAVPPRRPGAQPAEPEPVAEAAGIESFRELIPDIQVAVGQAVEGSMSALLERVTALEGQLADAKETIITVVSILHDLAAQTGGTFQVDGKPLDDVFEKDGKILSYMG